MKTIFKTIEEAMQQIPVLGAHKGGTGVWCDRFGDWSEQYYERGAIRSVIPKQGKPYWVVFTDEGGDK